MLHWVYYSKRKVILLDSFPTEARNPYLITNLLLLGQELLWILLQILVFLVFYHLPGKIRTGIKNHLFEIYLARKADSKSTNAINSLFFIDDGSWYRIQSASKLLSQRYILFYMTTRSRVLDASLYVVCRPSLVILIFYFLPLVAYVPCPHKFHTLLLNQ